MKKLKALDKILLITFVFILLFGLVSSFAINQLLTKLVIEKALDQIISATDLMAGTVSTEMDAGNLRTAWEMIHLNVGKNHFSDFVLLDASGNSLISDTQSENRIIPLWKTSVFANEPINDHINIKHLNKVGDILVEFKYQNLGNRSGVYSFLFLFEDNEISKIQLQISIYIFVYFSFLIIFIGYLIFFFRRKLLNAIEKVNLGLESILHGKPYLDEESIFSEYVQSQQTLRRFAEDFSETKVKLEDQIKVRTLGDLTRQVAHDIRSPLSALNMVMYGLNEIPEERRLLIRNAIQRINDISNDLLLKGKNALIREELLQSKEGILNPETSDSLLNQDSGAILLPAVIDSIVSEKRIQFRDKINIKIDSDLNFSFGTFVNINATDLSRIVSNLVNNSVEALPNEFGEVTVAVRGYEERAIIFVKDNGIGITEEVLLQLGEKEVSFGKESSGSGSGLGIYNAKRVIQNLNGSISIRSKIGLGTEVEINLPRVRSPSWFASSLELFRETTVVSVDDDLSIHHIWKGRLDSLKASEMNIDILCFTSSSEFKNLVLKDNMFFLIDYELINQKETGLDLIQQKGIAARSILVTSRHEESHIKNACIKLGIRILPKQLAGFIPILINKGSKSI